MEAKYTSEREAELLADIDALTKNRDEAVVDRNKFLAERDRLKEINAELLEALKSAIGMLRGCQETPERVARYERARSAIAKATGK